MCTRKTKERRFGQSSSSSSASQPFAAAFFQIEVPGVPFLDVKKLYEMMIVLDEKPFIRSPTCLCGIKLCDTNPFFFFFSQYLLLLSRLNASSHLGFWIIRVIIYLFLFKAKNKSHLLGHPLSNPILTRYFCLVYCVLCAFISSFFNGLHYIGNSSRAFLFFYWPLQELLFGIGFEAL